MQFSSLSICIEEAITRKSTISRLTLEYWEEQGESSDEIFGLAQNRLKVMKKAAIEGSRPDNHSLRGWSGGDGSRIKNYMEKKNQARIFNPFCLKVIQQAIVITEYNASGGIIVACPTAGACGVWPASILTLQEERHLKDHDVVMALLTADTIKLIIANNASIAGATGGCQAEIGSAAAMTAGSLVELMGGTPDMVSHAVAFAIQSFLGLVCDPVAGLVEVPCIHRNAGASMIALTTAEMALAGLKNPIPADEMIMAMKEVSDSLPAQYRETGEGGTANTATAKIMADSLKRSLGDWCT